MPSGFWPFLILRFLELSSLLDPGNSPKIDKAAILSDAARLVSQLRSEAKSLKESNESLQEKINELKVFPIYFIVTFFYLFMFHQCLVFMTLLNGLMCPVVLDFNSVNLDNQEKTTTLVVQTKPILFAQPSSPSLI